MNLWLAAAWYAARCGRGNGVWKGGLGRRHPLAPAALSVAFGHSRSEGAAHGTFSSQLQHSITHVPHRNNVRVRIFVVNGFYPSSVAHFRWLRRPQYYQRCTMSASRAAERANLAPSAQSGRVYRPTNTYAGYHAGGSTPPFEPWYLNALRVNGGAACLTAAGAGQAQPSTRL